MKTKLWESIMQLSEQWKAVKGFENYYQVSNKGRVKSVARAVLDSIGRNKLVKERILKPWFDGNYYYVILYKNGVQQNICIHRLVATAFITNTNNLPEVNHKDENKLNNAVSNLEWCTRQYNAEYSLAKPIIQITLNDEHIRIWKSATMASHELGISNSSICNCLKGRYKNAGGFKWAYSNN